MLGSIDCGGEAEQLAQVALLEDPHQRAERGRDREEVGQDRLQRQDDRAGEQEQHDVGDQQHRADGDRCPLEDEVDDVEVEGRLARGQHLAVRARCSARIGVHDLRALRRSCTACW